MFRYYIRRILASPVYIGCVLLLLAVMLFGCAFELGVARESTISVLTCFRVSNSVGVSHVLIPMITALPFLFFFVDELEKKAVYYQLMRTNWRSCYGGRIGAALVSSMAVTALSLFLFTLICMAFGAGWKTSGVLEAAFEETFFEESLKKNTGLTYLVCCIALILYSAPWIVSGMVVSVFSKNRYLILALPGLFYLALSYLIQSLYMYWQWPLFIWLNPGHTLLKRRDILALPGGGIFYTLCYHAILSILLIVVYWTESKRRIRREGL